MTAGPLTIRGVVYAKGLGVHALSDLRYTLPANCTSFNAIVGLDDEAGGLGSVDFQVYLDGGTSPVYDSGLVTGTSAAKTVAVNLTGHTQLRLVVAVRRRRWTTTTATGPTPRSPAGAEPSPIIRAWRS